MLAWKRFDYNWNEKVVRKIKILLNELLSFNFENDKMLNIEMNV